MEPKPSPPGADVPRPTVPSSAGEQQASWKQRIPFLSRRSPSFRLSEPGSKTTGVEVPVMPVTQTEAGSTELNSQVPLGSETVQEAPVSPEQEIVQSGAETVAPEPPQAGEEIGVVVDVQPAINSEDSSAQPLRTEGVEAAAQDQNPTETPQVSTEASLSPEAQKVLEGLLSEDRFEVGHAMPKIAELPVSDAITVITRFARENQSDAAAFHADNAVRALNLVLLKNRWNQADGSLNLTGEQRQAMTNLFTAFRETLYPTALRSAGGIREFPADAFADHINAFIRQNPEFRTDLRSLSLEFVEQYIRESEESTRKWLAERKNKS